MDPRRREGGKITISSLCSDFLRLKDVNHRRDLFQPEALRFPAILCEVTFQSQLRKSSLLRPRSTSTSSSLLWHRPHPRSIRDFLGLLPSRNPSPTPLLPLFSLSLGSHKGILPGFLPGSPQRPGQGPTSFQTFPEAWILSGWSEIWLSWQARTLQPPGLYYIFVCKFTNLQNAIIAAH